MVPDALRLSFFDRLHAAQPVRHLGVTSVSAASTVVYGGEGKADADRRCFLRVLVLRQSSLSFYL